MRRESALQKVIVRMQDGQIVAGFADRHKLGAEVEILTREAKQQIYGLGEIKALFFVRDFQGNPEYREMRFLDKQNGSSAVWVRVQFSDGETLEGRVENNFKLMTGPGFYLWPSDSDTNNECAYIPKAALVDFRILSAD